MLFEVPSSWVVCPLETLATFGGGKTPSMDNKEYWNNGRHLWVTSKDMKSVHIVDSLMKISDSALEQMTVYPKGTLLLVTRSGILRHTLPIAILDKEATINQDIKTISCYYSHLQTFIYYAIKAQEQIILKEYHKDGTTVDSIDFDKFKKLPIPLPPLKEQIRIIAEIAKWFSLIDTIENNKDDLQEAIQQAKSKILDLAIHGKLVPQDPNDESASELLKRINPNAEITCDNGQYRKMPFEMPNSWEWCRLKDCCHIVGRIGFRGYTKDDLVTDGNGAITLSPSNIINGMMNYDKCTFISWYKYEESPEIQVSCGDILLVKTGSSFGKCALVEHLPKEATINPQFVVLKHISIEKQYLTYVLKSNYARNNYNNFVLGTAIPTFTQVVLGNMQIPLPPLEEQQRIVAKINELFASLDNIQKALEV